MPFKSEAQRKFFHAATEPGFRGDADISKKDVKKWERETPKGKKLPEHVSKKAAFVRMATDLGRMHAREKTAGLLDTLVNLGGRYAKYWVPAAGGAILAGPGYHTEGALAGLLAGHLGGRAGEAVGLRGLKGAPQFFEGKPLSAYRATAHQLGAGKAVPGLVNATELGKTQRALRHAKLLGRITGGAAGGYGAGRLLGAQNPYGMQPVFPGMGKENPMGIRPA